MRDASPWPNVHRAFSLPAPANSIHSILRNGSAGISYFPALGTRIVLVPGPCKVLTGPGMSANRPSFIPETLKIGAHEVRVLFADSWPEADPDTLGHSFPERGEIFIKTGLPDSQSFVVFIHEVMHFCNGTMNHEVLDSLAQQLGQVLWDNDLINEP